MAFLFYFAGMNFICVNGKIFQEDEPVLKASNRSYRYGDGLFETMKVLNAWIILGDFHFERLFGSMAILKMVKPGLFTREKINEAVLFLCEKNKCSDKARVRISVTRGNGGLNDEDNSFQYLIETWPLDSQIDQLNENGLVIDIYPDARKSCDVFSNLKSANYLPYVMAARFAKENKLNECLILNTHQRICDATIANVFWVRNGVIFTPPLSEGCVAGVMRKYLLEKLKDNGYNTQEQVLIIDDLLNADEIFLSNAVYGIRWVGQYRDRSYQNELSKKIFKELIEQLL